MQDKFIRLGKGFFDTEQYGWAGQFRWPLLSIVVGIIAGLGAILFEESLRFTLYLLSASAHRICRARQRIGRRVGGVIELNPLLAFPADTYFGGFIIRANRLFRGAGG